jgi:hypothetical protein
MLRAAVAAIVVFPLALGFATPASASFHEMQIEQVVGGVCGDPAAQAIQLRLRDIGQNLVGGRKLIAYDATGANPITLLTFPGNVTNSALGARILVTTPESAAAFGIAGDFTLTQRIPESYLAAGKVTFEDSGLGVLWALAWGGAAYTGSNTGTMFNDPDGIFSPAVAVHLPYNQARSVLFQGAAGAMSTNNAADYALTTGAATLTNNTGNSSTTPACFFGDGFQSGDLSVWSGSQ